MSPMDDTNPNRGRPVLKRLELDDLEPGVQPEINELVRDALLWMFCGEYEGNEQRAKDAAGDQHGPGIYKVFPSGSWPGGYLRD